MAAPTHQEAFNKLTLNSSNGSTAEIYPYGAHLTSWKTALNKEWIFLSQKAKFEEGKAIRGGVPIIFPQFNAFGSGPRHGFARNLEWTRHENESQSPEECAFSLRANKTTLDAWPFQFQAQYKINLQNNQMSMTLNITNTDTKPFNFTAALHTYLAVQDYSKASISGLSGLYYWDNNGSEFNHRESSLDDQLRFSGPIDRVYFDCTTPLQLNDGNNHLCIKAQGFSDVVVWNPGAKDAKNMGDMGDLEYNNMLCIEAAVIDTPVILEPGETWLGSQILIPK